MRPRSQSHEARKALFRLGIRRGTLTVEEIERALPSGTLSPAERWLLLYSLRAAGVEISGGEGRAAQAPRERAGGPVSGS